MNLTELNVKPTCLDFLELPIRVKHGHVGQLSLEANWRKLTSQPVKVVLDRIFVVAGPKTEFKVDHAAQLKVCVMSPRQLFSSGCDSLYAFSVPPYLFLTLPCAWSWCFSQSAIESKLQSLATTEAFTLANEGESEDGKKSEGGDTFVGRLTAKIVNNIKVTINHIHIRYVMCWKGFSRPSSHSCCSPLHHVPPRQL